MQTKTLGRTGLEVSIVGLGTGFLGRIERDANAERQIDEQVGFDAVVGAIESGCSLVDTAPLYGRTMSEHIIGRVLSTRPDLAATCTVTTKVGYDGLDGSRDYSYDAVMRCVEGSMTRLGLDDFSILYIHDPMGVPMEKVMAKDGALGALRKLQDDGVVQFVGIAANDPEANGPYIETGEFDAAVVPDAWSLLDRTADRLIFPAAEKHKVGIVLATPLERGLLATGPLPSHAYLNRVFGQDVLGHVGKIKALCDDYGIPLVAASLQWCSRHPLIAATIPGGRNKQEAVQNARGGALDIPEAFWDDLAPMVKDWAQAHVVKVGG